MKPKVRDHYHSHRLSFWLKLIPGLHQPTPDDEAVDIDGGIYLRHHLLVDHENPSSYDGIVRQIALKFLQPAPTAPSPSVQIQKQLKPQQTTQSSNTSHLKQSSKTSSSSNSIKQNDDIYKEKLSVSGVSVVQNSSNNKTYSPESMTRNQNDSNTNQNDSNTNQSDTYTTALSVTIAIGCSLLVLNMLIFAGVYYQLERSKKRENSSEGLTVDKSNTLTRSAGHAHHHHFHSLEV